MSEWDLHVVKILQDNSEEISVFFKVKKISRFLHLKYQSKFKILGNQTKV